MPRNLLQADTGHLMLRVRAPCPQCVHVTTYQLHRTMFSQHPRSKPEAMRKANSKPSSQTICRLDSIASHFYIHTLPHTHFHTHTHFHGLITGLSRVHLPAVSSSVFLQSRGKQARPHYSGPLPAVFAAITVVVGWYVCVHLHPFCSHGTGVAWVLLMDDMCPYRHS